MQNSSVYKSITQLICLDPNQLYLKDRSVVVGEVGIIKGKRVEGLGQQLFSRMECFIEE